MLKLAGGQETPQNNNLGKRKLKENYFGLVGFGVFFTCKLILYSREKSLQLELVKSQSYREITHFFLLLQQTSTCFNLF